MKTLVGPSAPPAPQRATYAQACIDVSKLTNAQDLHKLAIPPHSVVFGDTTSDLSTKKRPEDRLQPVNACGTTFLNANQGVFGVVQDSMLDTTAIRSHPGHRHVGVCVQGLVTVACNNEDLKGAQIGDYLYLDTTGTHTFHGAPSSFQGLKLSKTTMGNNRMVGKIYGFSTTRANEVEVLLR